MMATAEMLDRRLAQIRARAAERELDGVLIRHLPNIRYLTGFTGSNGWLWVSSGRPIFCTDGRYRTQAEAEIPAELGIELLIFGSKLLSGLIQRLSAGRAVRAGFEEDRTTYAEWRKLEAAEEIEWMPVSGWVESLRAVKAPDEIAAIRGAAEIAQAALEETLPHVRPDVREIEIAALLDRRMYEQGAERPAFETIVASGPRSALPHARSGPRQLERGDLLLIDFGAVWQGYCCDLTRTFALGMPSPNQREAYARVVESREAALGVLRSGETGAAVDSAARRIFEAAGLKDHFTHSTGHGLGLEVHEGPRLHRDEQAALPDRAVVTVEPGVYFPGQGGIRLEDDFLVTADGCEPLSRPAEAELLPLS